MYVASPHPMHKDDALLCLRHGKAVLCEKPFTINAAQAEEVIGVARQNNVFLMEAMWTRFLPAVQKVREFVREGAVGDVQIVQADFGFRAGFDPKSRLFDPALGGGALLDVGVYCVSFASMLLGTPEHVVGTATLGKTGVDETAGVLLRYGSGAVAALSTTILANTPGEATIIGTAGRIKVHAPFWVPSVLTLSRDGQSEEALTLPFVGNGYNYQADEVARCVAQGLTESPQMPLGETLDIMKTMDTLRAQWGVRYPME